MGNLLWFPISMSIPIMGRLFPFYGEIISAFYRNGISITYYATLTFFYYSFLASRYKKATLFARFSFSRATADPLLRGAYFDFLASMYVESLLRGACFILWGDYPPLPSVAVCQHPIMSTPNARQGYSAKFSLSDWNSPTLEAGRHRSWTQLATTGSSGSANHTVGSIKRPTTKGWKEEWGIGYLEMGRHGLCFRSC